MFKRCVSQRFPNYLQAGIIASCLLAPWVVLAADVDANTAFETQWAINTDELDSQVVQLAIKPEVVVNTESGAKLTVIGKLLAESIDGVRPGDVNRDGYSSVSKPALLSDSVSLELREAYYEAAVKNDYFIVGKQQVVWGKADGLKVLDVVNPQSFREFILDDFEDSRIPLWMLNYEWQTGDNTIFQLLWIPDQTMHALPGRNATYVFTTPRIVPVAPPGVAVETRSVDRPSRFIADGDIGIRWSAFIEGWDLTLNYLYHYDDFPVFYQRLSNAPTGPKVIISPEYERSHLLGGTFSNAYGDMTIRGEIGYSSNRFFITRNPAAISGVVKSDELSYVLGFDWFGFNEALLSFQFFQSIVLDSPTGLTRPIVDNTVTFLAQKEFFNDTLKAEMLVIRNLQDRDGLLRPKITYDWKDDIKIWGAADVFYGNEQGLYGQFDDNDRILFGLEVLM